MFEQYILKPFLEAAEIFAERNAICINTQFFTYKTFLQYVSAIRANIHPLNIGNKNIGLVANDDVQTYASIFAIWLEGSAYVPLHPMQPLSRNLDIAELAKVDLILDSSKKSTFNTIKVLETENLQLNHEHLDVFKSSDNELAYLLFTSGSTGKPKGVPISRKNLGAFTKSFLETGISIDENDRCLQCFDLTFDVSVQAFLIPLINGACVYTIPHTEIKYSYAAALLEDHNITFAAMAPSMIRYLKPYFQEIDLPALRYSIVTAEASPIDLIDEWAICIPNAAIYNFYGPTETTIYCTYYKYLRNKLNKGANGMLSIGRPLPGLEAIIVDVENKLVPQNEKGELCISGDQLSAGYWNEVEKSDAVFFEKYIYGNLTRFYKTGDYCHQDNEGMLILSGRIDFQVKIEGYRIELGEIEAHAREFLKGINVLAIDFENFSGNTELALFVEKKEVDQIKLKSFLKTKLPFYMVPRLFVCEEIFPLNANGKVDRGRLRLKILN